MHKTHIDVFARFGAFQPFAGALLARPYWEAVAGLDYRCIPFMGCCFLRLCEVRDA
jgi:hypothetical protein